MFITRAYIYARTERTRDEAAAGAEVVRHEAEHEVVVGVVEAIGVNLVVEALRHQAHSHVAIQHHSARLFKVLWLDEMIAVHDHENVTQRDIVRIHHVRIDVVEHDVVNI
jgi:hypothetical protein